MAAAIGAGPCPLVTCVVPAGRVITRDEHGGGGRAAAAGPGTRPG